MSVIETNTAISRKGLHRSRPTRPVGAEDRKRAYRRSTLSYGNLDFADKRVVLVGSGTSMLGTGLGTQIDEFDTVIRFREADHHIEEFKEDCGTKTDILVANGEPSAATRFNEGLKAGDYPRLKGVLFSNAPTYRSPTLMGLPPRNPRKDGKSYRRMGARFQAREALYQTLMELHIPFKIVSSAKHVYRHPLVKRRTFAATAGFGMLFYLSTMGCKEIAICGYDRLYDIHDNKHYYPVANPFYNTSLSRHHNLDKEEPYIRKLIKTDNRVHML